MFTKGFEWKNGILLWESKNKLFQNVQIIKIVAFRAIKKQPKIKYFKTYIQHESLLKWS